MEKNLKITKKKQMEILVELMTQNPDIGRGKPSFGCNKMQLKDKWDQFTTKLNSMGPHIRNAKEWQRVWTHYKANLKRKLAANKRSIQATGGGPYTEISLSSLEQTTIELVSMQSQVDPSGSAVGLQALEESDVEHLQANFEPQQALYATPKSRTRSKSEMETERLALLKTQARTQEKVLKTLKKSDKNSY